MDLRSLGSAVVLLLLDSPNPPAGARGHFALTAKLLELPALLVRALHIPWLGPGLVLAFLLLATLKDTRDLVSKPLQRRVHPPELDRYRGRAPRRHRDLEI